MFNASATTEIYTLSLHYALPIYGYHHIDEDIALLKELGIDIYRFSISWARLYPH